MHTDQAIQLAIALSLMPALAQAADPPPATLQGHQALVFLLGGTPDAAATGDLASGNQPAAGPAGQAGTFKIFTMPPTGGAAITDGTSNTLMVGEKPPAPGTPAPGTGGPGVYRSTDGGSTWTSVPNPAGGTQASPYVVTQGGGAFKTRDAGGSSLRGFQGIGSINDMFANSRGGDQGTAPLVAVQKAPIKNLVGGQPTANNGSSQPPPPPPPPPPSGPAAPLPVLLVIANRDFYAPPPDKPLTTPTVPGASVPAVQSKTLAGAATNQAVQPSLQLQRLANPSLQRK